MHSLSETVAQTRNGSDGIGPRAQVRHLAQMLEGMPLGGNRIGFGIVDPANNLDTFCLHLDFLVSSAGFHQFAPRNDGAARGQVQDFLCIVGQRLVGDNLNGIKAGAVMQVDE